MSFKTTVRVALGVIALDLILALYWTILFVYFAVEEPGMLTTLGIFSFHWAGMLALLAYFETVYNEPGFDYDMDVAVYNHGKFPLSWGVVVIFSTITDLFAIVDWALLKRDDTLNLISETTYALLMTLYVVAFVITLFSLVWILFFYFTYVSNASTDTYDQSGRCLPTSNRSGARTKPFQCVNNYKVSNC